MGRKAVLAGFWAVGFAIGFFGYLLFPALSQLFKVIPSLLYNEMLLGAVVSGAIGSTISTLAVELWGRFSE